MSPTAEAVVDDDADKAAATVTGKRQILPSSMGLSVLVPERTKSLEVTVCWGDYHPEYAEDHRRVRRGARAAFALSATARREAARSRRQDRGLGARAPRTRRVTICSSIAPSIGPGTRRCPRLEWPEPGLAEPHRPSRGRSTRGSCPTGPSRSTSTWSTTVQPIHGAGERPAHGLPGRADGPLRGGVRAEAEPERAQLGRRDDRVADLQYRDVYEFAVGHNVSAIAELDADGAASRPHGMDSPRRGRARRARQACKGITLGMEALGRLADFEQARELIGLADQYEAWIVGQAKYRGRPAP